MDRLKYQNQELQYQNNELSSALEKQEESACANEEIMQIQLQVLDKQRQEALNGKEDALFRLIEIETELEEQNDRIVPLNMNKDCDYGVKYIDNFVQTDSELIGRPFEDCQLGSFSFENRKNFELGIQEENLPLNSDIYSFRSPETSENN